MTGIAHITYYIAYILLNREIPQPTTTYCLETNSLAAKISTSLSVVQDMTSYRRDDTLKPNAKPKMRTWATAYYRTIIVLKSLWFSSRE